MLSPGCAETLLPLSASPRRIVWPELGGAVVAETRVVVVDTTAVLVVVDDLPAALPFFDEWLHPLRTTAAHAAATAAVRTRLVARAMGLVFPAGAADRLDPAQRAQAHARGHGDRGARRRGRGPRALRARPVAPVVDAHHHDARAGRATGKDS